jgi:ceramide glucosyltransferase
MPTWSDSIGFGCIALTALGCVYALAATALLPRWRGAATGQHAAQPGVTILKPLRGAEPSLADNLRSFCAQRYDSPVQLLFGVEDEGDAAAAVVRTLAVEYPLRDIALVAGGAFRSANPKVATLMALEPRIRHEVVVLADSDIKVAPDYLTRIVSALQGSNVGLVTCLYRGEAMGGVWARLAAMAINHQFLPSVIVGVRLRLARPCFGSTIALRRDTLAAIGGFGAFADHLADDHAIGEAVRATGMRVEIPDFLVTHACSERTARELVSHELRWGRTIRALNPSGYAASVITYPLPFALAACVLLNGSATGGAALAAALACRLVLALGVDHNLGLASARLWLGPVRDLLSFAIFAASFFVRTVTWRGRRYRVRADATVAAL